MLTRWFTLIIIQFLNLSLSLSRMWELFISSVTMRRAEGTTWWMRTAIECWMRTHKSHLFPLVSLVVYNPPALWRCYCFITYDFHPDNKTPHIVQLDLRDCPQNHPLSVYVTKWSFISCLLAYLHLISLNKLSEATMARCHKCLQVLIQM